MQGTAGDMNMNTLECRFYHAGAASVPDPHCFHAGPLGSAPGDDSGSQCGGMRCSSFCQAAFEICEGNDAQWGTQQECQDVCAMFPDDIDYNTLETGGDSLACRMYHLSVAADAKANGDAAGVTTHCGHTALDSSTCGGG
jgi:hypothetical protein